MNRQMDMEVSEVDAQHLKQATRMVVGTRSAASAAMVNRTHRVVHERAKTMQARRSKVRSLLIPLCISTGLLVTLACALWTAFEDFEGTSAGLPNTSGMVVILVWSVPISAMILAVIWFRRANSSPGN